MAYDIYHQPVKQALLKDGWAITHDPLRIDLGVHRAFIDFGAERPLGAEKNGKKIAIEVKSFIGHSLLSDLEKALGQYLLYYSWLQRTEPNRKLYLSVSTETFRDVFMDVSTMILIKDYRIAFMVVNMALAEVAEWIE